MENTQRIKHYQLNSISFEKYPIWTWDEDIAFDDSEDWVCPATKTDILSGDYDILFIKSNFVTKENREFSGYIIYDGADVFAIGIFVEGDDKFLFNVRLKDISNSRLKELKQKLEIEDEEVFPIHYKTSLPFETGKYIEGNFQLK